MQGAPGIALMMGGPEMLGISSGQEDGVSPATQYVLPALAITNQFGQQLPQGFQYN